MAENLKTTKYNDGTPIPQITDNLEWRDYNTAAWCWYDNDSASYDSIYGKLYNYYVVTELNSKNVCPIGWHVPTDSEWTILREFLESNGFENKQGYALASEYIWDGIDQYGFNGLPGGQRSGYSNNIGQLGVWYGSTGGYYYYIWSNVDLLHHNNHSKSIGNSVRCVKG